MKVISWDSFIKGGLLTEKTAVSAGFFDGVHRGHRALLARLRASGFAPLVVTFSKHPRGVLNPSSAPALIMTLPERLRAFENEGVKYVILIDFTNEFSKMKGETFLELIRKNSCAEYMAFGASFRCGQGGSLTAAEAMRLNAEAGLRTEIVSPIIEGNLPVSSSRVRAALEAGDTDLASRLLQDG